MLTALVAPTEAQCPGGAWRLPIAQPDTVVYSSGSMVASDVLANDSHPEGVPLRVSSCVPSCFESVPGVGLVSIESDGRISFIPEAGFQGTHRLTYRVTDALGCHAASDVWVDLVAGLTSYPVPISPSGLTLSLQVIGSTEIQLAWLFAGSGETGFEVESQVAGGSFALLATLPAGADSYIHGGLSPNTVYCYRTRALLPSGNVESDVECATTPGGGGGNLPPDPGPPVELISGGRQTVFLAEELLANSSDPEGEALCFDDVVSRLSDAGGQLVPLGPAGTLGCGLYGRVAYYPPAGGITQDSFQFRIRDEVGQSALARANVTIVADAPQAILFLNCYCPGCSLAANECSFSTTSSSDGRGDPLPNSAIHLDFGDGTQIAGVASGIHAFPEPGAYLVTLTVTDPYSGLTDSMIRTGIAGNPPLAIATVADCGPNRACQFDASGSDLSGVTPEGSTLEYYWQIMSAQRVPNFNSGVMGPTAAPVLTYPRPGQGDAPLPFDALYRVHLFVQIIPPLGSASWYQGENSFFATEFPPVARFTADCDPSGSLVCGMSASTSSDDHGLVSYRWDFGGGTIRTGEEVVHQFADAGYHQVSLTVTDNAQPAQSDTVTRFVLASPPSEDPVAHFLVRSDPYDSPPGPISRTGGGTPPITELSWITLDATPSRAAAPPDPLIYEWSLFADGAQGQLLDRWTTGDPVGIWLAARGDYRYELRVQDPQLRWSAPVSRRVLLESTEDLPPQAYFVPMCVADASGAFDCTFDASPSRDPEGGSLTFSWDFSDPVAPGGVTTTSQVVSHRYTQPDVHVVALTVSDPGNQSDTYTWILRLGGIDEPPRAVLGVVGCDGLVCELDGSRSLDDAGIADAVWTLTPSSGGIPSKYLGPWVQPELSQAGEFQVDLAVADASGQSSSVSASLSGSRRPVIVWDEAVATPGIPLTLQPLANDSDPDGDPLSLIEVSKPNHGAATLGAGGAVQYQADEDFEGVDAFGYLATDGVNQEVGWIVVTVAKPSGGK